MMATSTATPSLRVFLDMDGVLCDFVGAALRLHGRGDLPRSEVGWNLDKQLGIPPADFWAPMGAEFWAGLDWTREGREIVAIVEGIFGRDNVAILTSLCLTPGCSEGKTAWVAREMPEYRRRLIITPVKHMLAAPDTLLIDDSGTNADDFRERGLCMLVPRPWNTARVNCDGRGNFDPTFLERGLLAIKARHEAGDAGYLRLLQEMADLHKRKSADYGSDSDPFANIRASEAIGVEPWKSAWIRARDKVHRIDQFCLKGTLANEGVEDSFMDLSAYCLIALCLRREEAEDTP